MEGTNWPHAALRCLMFSEVSQIDTLFRSQVFNMAEDHFNSIPAVFGRCVHAVEVFTEKVKSNEWLPLLSMFKSYSQLWCVNSGCSKSWAISHQRGPIPLLKMSLQQILSYNKNIFRACNPEICNHFWWGKKAQYANKIWNHLAAQGRA